jgi:hypothetical protein
MILLIKWLQWRSTFMSAAVVSSEMFAYLLIHNSVIDLQVGAHVQAEVG